MKNIIIPIAIFIFLFSSCQSKIDSPFPETQANETSLSSIKIQSVTPYNFDNFGLSHNQCMAYVRANPDFGSMTDEDRYNYIQTYKSPYITGVATPMEWKDFKPKGDLIDSIVGNIFKGITPSGSMKRSGFIESDTMGIFLDKLATVFQDALLPDSTLMDTVTFSNRIMKLQRWVSSNQTVQIDTISRTCNDGAMMMIVSTIAQYSYNYWYVNYDNWYSEQDTSKPEMHVMFLGLGKVWRSIKKAALDAYGFAIEPWHYCNGQNIWGGVCWNYYDALYTSQEESGSVN